MVEPDEALAAHDEGHPHPSCPLVLPQLQWPWARVAVGQLSPLLVSYLARGQEPCVEVTPRWQVGV